MNLTDILGTWVSRATPSSREASDVSSRPGTREMAKTAHRGPVPPRGCLSSLPYLPRCACSSFQRLRVAMVTKK